MLTGVRAGEGDGTGPRLEAAGYGCWGGGHGQPSWLMAGQVLLTHHRETCTTEERSWAASLGLATACCWCSAAVLAALRSLSPLPLPCTPAAGTHPTQSFSTLFPLSR